MARFEMGSPEMGGMAEMQPNAEGLFNLGIVYATGLDGDPDLVAAHKWFNLAALRGNPEAAYHRQQLAGRLRLLRAAGLLRGVGRFQIRGGVRADGRKIDAHARDSCK